MFLIAVTVSWETPQGTRDLWKGVRETTIRNAPKHHAFLFIYRDIYFKMIWFCKKILETTILKLDLITAYCAFS